jgi:beta-lactamase superfamily II metal-dependent hydrolase
MAKAVIHVLDPGGVKYGDSILCNVGGKWILIDGARSTSTQATSSTIKGVNVQHKPLQDQIAAKRGSMHVDLLVITHCHSDHVGCLPKLIADHGLTFDWALVADSQLGFGLGIDEDLPPPDQMTDAQKLRMALREEPVRDGTDEEIEQFIADSANEYHDYKDLLTAIRNITGDDRLVIYKGPSDAESPGLNALLAAFASAQLRVLGPSQDQLLLCSDELLGRATDAVDAVADVLSDSGSLVDAYRMLIDRTTDATPDDPDGDNGNAVNCQSIILSLGAGGRKFLLTGDMQFAKTYLGPDADGEVNELVTAVKNNGPYYFVKLSHHGATNGQNEAMMRSWGAKKMVISTGSKSNQHPTKATLDALKRMKVDGFTWARTDMNGLCTYTLNNNGSSSLTKQRGSLNDLTMPDNRDAVGAEMVAEPETAITQMVSGDGHVEVIVKIPNARTRVAVTIAIEPEDPPPFD